MDSNQKNIDHIVVCEDDADDRFLLKTAFEESGYSGEIKFVENGVDLLHHLKEISDRKRNEIFPKFILLDLNMPKKDGRETLKELKENKFYRKIPVIIFTTTKNENEISRCYDLGANSYVVKPLVFDEMIKTIGTLHKYWLKVSAVAVP